MSAEPAAITRLRATELWRCVAVLVGLKTLLLALDPHLRLLLPDSGIYLQAAIDDLPPIDRSFLYAWLIRATALASGDALALIVLQTVFGVLAALGLFGWLRSQTVHPRIALVAAALFALEPAQLYYERSLVAEAAGGMLLVGFFIALSLYLARGRTRWIPCYVLLGLGAVAMRLNLLPVVLVLGVVAPLLRLIGMPARRRSDWLRQAAHLALALLATWASHEAYRQTYGRLSHGPVAYSGAAGRFRLGVVAPLVRPAHFEGSGVDPRVLDRLRIELDDPRQREAHIWLPGGLIDVVSRQSGEPDVAAQRISANALRDRPWAMLPIAASMLREHLDSGRMAEHLAVDLGQRAPNARLTQQLGERLGVDGARLRQHDRFAARWFAAGRHWLTACLVLLVPLALAAAWLGRSMPAPALRLLLLLAACGLVASHLLFSPLASFRYLHPLPWFVLASLALLGESLGRQRQARGGAAARNTQKRELR